ncbi:MAG: 4Fe-4S binding protein, partial [Planctomycetota bacterium]
GLALGRGRAAPGSSDEATRRGGWFERICLANVTGSSRLGRLPLVLGFLSGFNVCPPFLLAANEVLAKGGALRGATFFGGFFVGTSVWMVPLAVLPLAWRRAGSDGILRLARASAVVVGAAFLCHTVVLLRPAGTEGGDLAATVREMFPRASAVSFYEGPPRYEVTLKPGGVSPDVYVAVSEGEGFGGAVPVLTAVDRSGKVAAVWILPSRETPSYLRHVDNEKVLGYFKGRSYAEDMAIRDLDAICRATVTADAVSEAVSKAARAVAVGLIGMPPPAEAARRRFALGATDVLALVWVAAVAVVFWRARPRRWRTVALAASIVVLGLVARRFVSVSDWARMLAGAWPSWAAAAGWYLFLGAVVALTFARGRVYCTHMCPFGAMCSLLSRAPTARLRATGRAFAALRTVRWALLALTALGFAYTAGAAVFAYEPYGPTFDALSAPFRSSVSLADLVSFQAWGTALAAAALAASLFIPRFWCRFVCPAGAGVELIANASPFRARVTDEAADESQGESEDGTSSEEKEAE